MTTEAELEALIASDTASMSAKLGLIVRAAYTRAIQVTPGTQPQIAQTIDAFTRAPAEVKAGESSMLLWQTTNASAVLLNDVPVPPEEIANGSRPVTPNADTMYTLVAKRDGMPDVSRSVSVSVTPKVEPQTEPDPTADLLPSRAADGGSLHLNWMGDLIHVKDLPATPPYTRNLKFPSQNGVRPERWDSDAPWGNQLHLYDGTLMFKDGRIVMRDTATNPHHADVVQHAARMLADPPVVGPRGVGYVDPIATPHGHPADSKIAWFEIRADTALVALYWDGTSGVLGWVKSAVAPLDFSYTDTGKVLLTASQDGRIIRTDRTKALDNAKASGKPENDEEWEHSDLVSGIGRATGVRFTPWGIFACGGGNLVKIDADGTWSVFVAGISAFGIDYTDTQLAILTFDRTRVLLVDPVTAQVTPALTDGGVGLEFGTIEVDRPGHIGPKNSIYFSRTQGANNSNETFVLYEGKDFSAAPFFDAHPSGGTDRAGGWLSVGDTAYMPELGNHYPWKQSPHPLFPCLLIQGTGNLFPMVLFPQQPDRPRMASYDTYMGQMGLAIHAVGCYSQENAGTVPSFTAQMNLSCWSNIGISADAIVAEMGAPPDYGKMRDRIQNGLWGSYKRPDIIGYGLRGYGTYIIEASMQYQVVGAPLLEGWWAWCDVHAPGAPGPLPTVPTGPKPAPQPEPQPEPDPIKLPPVVVVGDPAGSLSAVSATLKLGEWGEVKSAGINDAWLDPDSPNTKLAMHYCNSAPWNPVAGSIDFVGMDHGGAGLGPDGTLSKGAYPALRRYHNAPNTWDKVKTGAGSHGYELTAYGGNGLILRGAVGPDTDTYPWDAASGIYRVGDDGSDTLYAPMPENFTNSIASCVLFWCGDRLGSYSGNTGAYRLMDEAARVAYMALPPEQQSQWPEVWKVWPLVATTTASGMYHNVAAYSEKYGCAVIGGGNDQGNGNSKWLWRVDGKVMTRLPDAPHPIGIHNGCNFNVGPDGNGYIIGFGELWMLDLSTNAWTQLPTPPAGTLFQNDQQAVVSCSTPYGIAYVQGQTANGVLDCRMLVYKCGDRTR